MSSDRVMLLPGGSLFLDRDGVINRNLPGEYVKDWVDFELLPGVVDAVARLRPLFRRILIFTNQQGVGKGLMTMEDVNRLHEQMLAVFLASGAKIDAVYVCPHLSEMNCSCRKPKIGMLHEAMTHFPDIVPERSIMVGDKESDMVFGRTAGAKTVLVQSNYARISSHADDVVTGLTELADKIVI